MTNDNERIYLFKGIKLNKREVAQVSFSIFSGCVGIAFALVIFGFEHKPFSLILISLFTAFGFYGYGHFRKKNK